MWHPMCFTHMTYLHINLSWQGEACGPPVNDRLNQWDAEPKAVSWTKFTLQSSKNTLWASLMLIFPVHQHNCEKLFFALKKVSQDNLMDKSRIFFSLSKSMGSWTCESNYAGVWKKSFLAGDGVYLWNFCFRLRLTDWIIWNDIFTMNF